MLGALGAALIVLAVTHVVTVVCPAWRLQAASNEFRPGRSIKASRFSNPSGSHAGLCRRRRLGRQIKLARRATREPVSAACNGWPTVGAPEN